MRNNILPLSMLFIAGVAFAANQFDFVGSYAPSRWVAGGITGGSATVDLPASSSVELVVHYDVDLGEPGPGVSYRSSDFEVVSAADGLLSFSWEYTYDHRIHQPDAELWVYSVDASGSRSEILLHSDSGSFGTATYNGDALDIDVYAGRPFGIRVGGSNLDSDSEISGTVVLTNFVVEDLADCNGVVGGSATFDQCGVCDSNPSNDCVQDCAGVWGGTAQLDLCGACDSNPNNDCDVDCAGTPGGSAVQDMCGICDAISSNDCVQDCLGNWGGVATMDACGVCDADPTNDCGPDCNGVVGGSAVQDECGICDADASNDCVQDCRGNWGGPAKEDMCGVCDTNDSNDCEQDCAGEWGGGATLDDCDECVGGSTGLAPCEPSTTDPTTVPTGDDDDDDDGTTPSTTDTDTDTEDVLTGGTDDANPAAFTRAGCGCATGSPGLAFGWLALVGMVGWRRARA